MSESDGKTTVRGILKKITMAACGAKPDIEKLIAFKNANGAAAIMPLLTVYGIASDFKAGAGKDGMGDYVRFLGQFKAVNVETGEVFISGACILPGAAPDMVFGALRSLGEAGGSIEFAFNIGVKFDADSATKYVYSVQQITSLGQSDPLAALESKLQVAVPAPGNVSQIADKTGTGSKKK